MSTASNKCFSCELFAVSNINGTCCALSDTPGNSESEHRLPARCPYRNESYIQSSKPKSEAITHQLADELLKLIKFESRMKSFLRCRYPRVTYHFIEECIHETYVIVLLNIVAGRVECAKQFLSTGGISEQERIQLAAYSYQVVKRTAAQLYRRKKSDPHISNVDAIDLYCDWSQSSCNGNDYSAFDLNIRQICLDCLRHARKVLEPVTYEALLRRLRGATLGEIAHRFRCDRNQAANIIRAACIVIGDHLLDVIPPLLFGYILEELKLQGNLNRYERDKPKATTHDKLQFADPCILIADRAVRFFSKTQRQLRIQKVRRRAPPI